MGGDGLDAQLEPVAQALIIIIVLIGVSSNMFFIINKLAIRRKEKAHNKLSTSRRPEHTWVDLSGGGQGPEDDDRSSRSSRPTGDAAAVAIRC